MAAMAGLWYLFLMACKEPPKTIYCRYSISCAHCSKFTSTQAGTGFVNW